MTTSCGRIIKDENGLILPRKIANPCVESPFRRDLHREIKWNSNKGINVLNNKTELERAFAKHKKNLDEKQKEQEKTETFSNEFQKMLADRAKRLERLEKSDDNAEEEEAAAVSNKSPKQSKIQAINSHINNTSPAEIIRTKPSQNQAIKSPQRRSSPPKSSPTSAALGSSENLESEFTRVFNQMRRDKQELVV